MEAIKVYNKDIVQKGICRVYEGVNAVEMILGSVSYLNLIEKLENIAGEYETQAILDTLEAEGITIRSTTFEG